jgi:hypothetical protein
MILIPVEHTGSLLSESSQRGYGAQA